MAKAKKPPVEEKPSDRPFRPNMLVLNGNAESSTVAQTELAHSVFTFTKFFNSRFHQSNLEGCSFDECDFDGSTFTSCSFQGAEFNNCDVSHLVINGINIGSLLRLLARDGGKNG